MRVLHLGKYYAPQRGGIERHLQDLSEWTARKGVSTGALVHQPPGRWRGAHETHNGVDIWRVGCLAAPLYAPLSPGYPLQLARILSRWKPDLLHLHLPNPACLFALSSRQARELPWVVHWHADISAEVPRQTVRLAYAAYRPFEQAALARARAIIATSQRYLDASTALADWRAKVHVVPLGIGPVVDVKPDASPWPEGGGPRILAVGRLSHYKGFEVLLEALARIPHGRLLLIGDGESAAALHERARALAIDARVRFVRHLDDSDLESAYAGADLFVLPSLDRSEAFGLVLLEAMRAGLPVIASDVRGSGIGHVVVAGQTGVLVPPGDADRLATALTALGADADARSRLGAAGHRRWQTEFSLDRSAQAVLDLYLEVLR